MRAFCRAWFTLCALVCFAAAGDDARGATPGGTVLSNTVSATYADGNGVPFEAVSNTVATTVASVSSVAVGPKENGCNPAADAFAVGTSTTKTFVVTNSSNIPDAYTLTASTTAGTIVSLATVQNGVVTPLGNGATSPTLNQGDTLQVLVTLGTAGIAIGATTEVTLTAKSTTAGAGLASDVASQCAISAGKATIGGAGGPASQVTKLVDGKAFEAVTPGQAIVYSIAYENYGGVPATSAVVSDVFPQGITPSLNSLQVNGVPVTTGATLVGQTLTVALGSLAPQKLYTLTINAQVSSAIGIGTSLLNTATVASANAATATSSPAAVLAGLVNVVYDGYVGAAAPISGATLSLVNAANAPVVLGGVPFAPNAANADPFTTGSGGTYAFGLGATQIGPVTYTLTLGAPGFVNRQIKLVLTPDATGTLYSVTLTALDGLPLAVPGGFGLTPGPVTLPSIAGVFGNLPLFRTQTIALTKTVDRSVASSGDRLVYTITFSNVVTVLGAATLTDTLPQGVAYAPGTALVDGVHLEPAISGRTLRWTFATLTTTHTVQYAAIVIPGAPQGTTLTNTATVTATPPNAPGTMLSATATADTRVISGLFSDCTIITGRVFTDRRGDGWFHPGDLGLANVRIYLEDGESVIADSNGRYDFPCVRPGMHVLKLDKSTLPTGTRPFDVRDYDSPQSPRRLVHGVFDGGTLQDVNFAIEAVQ